MAVSHSLGEVKDEFEGISNRMMCVKSSQFFFLVEVDQSSPQAWFFGQNYSPWELTI